MADRDLIDEIKAAADAVDVQFLSENEAMRRIERIAQAFVIDSRCQWWWESLVEPSKRISYAGSDGLAILEQMIESEAVVDLIVTDDAGPPWPVLSGNPRDVVRLLRRCRFFEFVVAAKDASWAVFDTHDNELVLTGRLAF